MSTTPRPPQGCPRTHMFMPFTYIHQQISKNVEDEFNNVSVFSRAFLPRSCLVCPSNTSKLINKLGAGFVIPERGKCNQIMESGGHERVPSPSDNFHILSLQYVRHRASKKAADVDSDRPPLAIDCEVNHGGSRLNRFSTVLAFPRR